MNSADYRADKRACGPVLLTGATGYVGGINILTYLTLLAGVQMLDGAIANGFETIEDALRANPEEH